MEPENQSPVALLQPSVYLQAVLAKLTGQWWCVAVPGNVACWVSHLEFVNHQELVRGVLDSDQSALVGCKLASFQGLSNRSSDVTRESSDNKLSKLQ